MASKIHQDYIARHPSRVKDVTNVEFVTKKLDEAMDTHTHNGTNSPQIDLSLNYDFNAAGGNVYVRTPGSSSDEGEYPDTSDLSNTYTRDVLDAKLNGKSNTDHTHVTNDIIGFPSALKNPETLTINGTVYDGSSPVNITVVDENFLNDQSSGALEVIMEKVTLLLNAKADLGHTHQFGDLENVYSDELLDMFFEQRDSEIASLKTRVTTTEEEMEALSNTVRAIKDSLYPVGSIYISVSPTDPSSFIGGTWEPWGSGRVPVGVDSTQTEFDTVEKEGGAKTHTLSIGEMPQHDHGMMIGENLGSMVLGSQAMTPVMSDDVRTSKVGGDSAHNNLQPYVTCYMWKRIE